MKYLYIILCTIVLGFIFYTPTQKPSTNDLKTSINPIIGNLSFVDRFGVSPDENVEDDLRIETHLSFVEKQLREKGVEHLPANLQIKRTEILNLLHDYWTRGVFPKNYDHAEERKPCFIDRDENICAVGYLVEQTVGRAKAEEINSQFQYATIEEMNSPILTEWVKESGLNLNEIAMIQPAYGTTPSDRYIEPSYAVPSALLSGVNVSLLSLNMMQMNHTNNSKFVPKLGLLLGIGQLTYGMIHFYKAENGGSSYFGYINDEKKKLSLINMGIGTSTAMLSAYNLLKNKKKKEKTTSWNVYGFPTSENQIEFGLSLTRGF